MPTSEPIDGRHAIEVDFTDDPSPNVVLRRLAAGVALKLGLPVGQVMRHMGAWMIRESYTVESEN